MVTAAYRHLQYQKNALPSQSVVEMSHVINYTGTYTLEIGAQERCLAEEIGLYGGNTSPDEFLHKELYYY